ncbi:MAG: trimethylamine methyltransferase family protein [Deltaproteobacteria bacterium]|nr:trimethylamine methyltransferase family protein [Deltaproteobacteria bacterium]
MYIPNAVPTFKMLHHDHCRKIHLTSLELLRRSGVRVHHPEALRLLKETDALITDENLVRFPPALVDWALSQAPQRITLCRRGTDAPALLMENMETNFGTGSDCQNYLDPKTGEHRLFTTPEIIDCIRLVDALPELRFCMSMGEPSEIEGHRRFCHQFSLMIEHTVKPIVFIAGGRRDCELIVAMAAAAAGGEEALRLNPTLLSYSQVTTPLVQPEESLAKLLFMAEKGLPTVHMPSPMMGGTAPVTMPGALALGNAEVLSSLVIHQLKRTGAPFVYGNGVHPMDMKTSISVYGGPEFVLARAAGAEMARYYHLPHFGYAAHTDSCVMDEQAATDAVFSILIAMMTGQHLTHDVGYMEAGLMTSPEYIVFAAEIISMMGSFTQGLSFDPESLATDLINQVGPGGNYIANSHTFKHFRELWQPTLFNRDRRSKWLAKGGARLGQRLRDKTIGIIESHRPEPLAESVREEIQYILKQR